MLDSSPLPVVMYFVCFDDGNCKAVVFVVYFLSLMQFIEVKGFFKVIICAF